MGTALNLIRFPAMSMKQFREFVGWFYYLTPSLLLASSLLGPTGILNSDERCDVAYMIGGAEPMGRSISTMSTPRKRIFIPYFSTLILNLYSPYKIRTFGYFG